MNRTLLVLPALALPVLLLGFGCGGQSPTAGASPANGSAQANSAPDDPDFAALRCQPASDPAQAEHWVTSWMTAPSDAIVARTLANQTERQMIAPHYDGEVVRFRLQNRFGQSAVTVSNVHIAKRDTGANLVDGSNCELSFDGSDTVTLQPGQSVASDPLYFPVRAFEKLAIDFYVPGTIDQPSRHLDAREIPYTSTPGNFSGQADGSPFLPSEFATANNWLLLEGLDVVAPKSVGVVVALGDSITDGADSLSNAFSPSNSPQNVGEDARYPDFLARRLLAAGKALSVGNAGISGNELIGSGLVPPYGIATLERYTKDVLEVPGVTDVIIMIGTNDFGNDGANTSAQDVIDGYIALISDLQSHGLNVLMGTIPPAKGFPVEPIPLIGGQMHGSADAIAKRATVNEWIKTSGVPDGVVDFEACLQDSSDPERMNPAFDSGDHLHPNPTGYAAMADCIDLDLL